MMMVLPALRNGKTLPREVTFIVDESGSMGGQSIHRQSGCTSRLKSLKAEDTFNIIAFDDGMRPLFDAPRPADTHLEAAEDFVNTIQADGGTDMAPADASRPDAGQRASGSSALHYRWRHRQRAGSAETHSGSPRITTTLSNRHRQCTQFGFHARGGSFRPRSFTAIAQINEVEEKMGVLIAKLENPSLTEIEVVAPGPKSTQSGQDLYLGEPMTAAKLTGKEKSIMVHGRLRDEAWEMKLPLEGGGSQAGVYKDWAKRIVDYHLDSRAFGSPEDEVRKEVVALAMKFNMVTPYTSLVAVDQLKKPVLEQSFSRQIASAAPHGSQYFGQLPQGSTPAPLLLLISLLSGLASVTFGRRSWAS